MENVTIISNKEAIQVIDKNANSFELTTQSIYSDIRNLKQNFILLGGHLLDLKNHINDIKKVFSYKLGRECKNIYEYVNCKFNLSKSTTISLMAICERFGEYRSCLKKEFEAYSYGQLNEMLPLTDEQLKLVNPDMTEKEIRCLKKVKKKVDQLTSQKSESVENKGIELGYNLKNDTDRLKFLEDYKTWPVLAEVSELGLKFYKCELNNGDFICVTSCDKWHGFNFRIIKKGTQAKECFYSRFPFSDKDYLYYMKTSKAKVLIKSSFYEEKIH